MIPTERTFELLKLLQLPGVGPARARDALAAASGGRLIDLAVDKLKITPELLDRSEKEAVEIVRGCAELNVKIIGRGDSGYPPRLAEISDWPPIIFVKGDEQALLRTCIAVVGTRQASEAGARIAKTISAFLAARDIVVVSGLAIGIDSAAHEGALAAHGQTVAVLAHGLDTVSPARNKDLARRLLDHGGALISEHPPGFPARPPEFVRRNRLQSGLSLGSVIVESDVVGGAMHQATFTRRQRRRLFVVLASTDDARRTLNEAGARHLIQTLEATPISSTKELAVELSRAEADVETPRSEGQRRFEW